MDKPQIALRINAIFEKDFELAPERLTPEAHLFQDLGLDSIDIVELMVALQKEFSIQLRDSDEARAIRSLDNLYDFILSEIAKQSQAAATGSLPSAPQSPQD